MRLCLSLTRARKKTEAVPIVHMYYSLQISCPFLAFWPMEAAILNSVGPTGAFYRDGLFVFCFIDYWYVTFVMLSTT